MTSVSTKRRHKRNKTLVEQWRGWPEGLRVTVKRDNGKTLKTVTTCEAFLLDGAHAMIRVEGIPGNVRLGRVAIGWNP